MSVTKQFNLPRDLLLTQKLAYEPLGFVCQHVVKEPESEEYDAFKFKLNALHVNFRSAKITPTKVGQFVTFWKRVGTGPIMPYDVTDPFDLLIINVRSQQRMGQFVFPKAVLAEQGILSKAGKGGKRAIRVYPAWDITNNRQAQKTQAWQLLYFFEIQPSINLEKAKLLFFFENE